MPWLTRIIIWSLWGQGENVYRPSLTMNHLVRYFLPSQVRGGYRFDEAFSQVDDASFGQLADGPCPWLRLLRLSLKFPQSCRKISIILPELIRNSRAGGSELFRRQLFEKRPRENVRNSDLTPEFPWENVRNSDLTPEFLQAEDISTRYQLMVGKVS